MTQILVRLNAGDRSAWQELLLAADEALRQMARAEMRRERVDHTLQPTALLHEAFLRLESSTPRFRNRGHFFAVVSRAMQQVLVEAHRKRAARKRGGGVRPLSLSNLDAVADGAEGPDARLEELRNVMEEMAGEPRLARKLEVVRLLFLEGCSITEAAAELGTSESTVSREWRFARAWLYDRLGRERDR